MGGGGSYTDINVTVTSQDKKTKLVYKITTYRGLKDSSSSSTSKSSTTKSSSASKSDTSSKSNSSGKTNSSQKPEGSEDLYEDKVGEANSILVKDNVFSSFMYGTLISAVAGIIIYIIYRYRNGPKGKHEI